MKKTIIYCILFLLSIINLSAQIVFEHTYDSASTYTAGALGSSQLVIIDFEISGPHYVNINRLGKYISIFDLNHTLVKTISCINFPMEAPTNGSKMGTILYLSENLFDTDPEIEFMYVVQTWDPGVSTTIYNEDGSILLMEYASPLVILNTPQAQYPIYNTPNGTKMILSYPTNHQAKVFGLAGTLNSSIEIANEEIWGANNLSVSNPHPNPASNFITIDYFLPEDANEGYVVFFDLNGKEIRRFKVGHTFSSLLISTAEIPAGTYYYQLQIQADATAAKRIVVIK